MTDILVKWLNDELKMTPRAGKQVVSLHELGNSM